MGQIDRWHLLENGEQFTLQSCPRKDCGLISLCSSAPERDGKLFTGFKWGKERAGKSNELVEDFIPVSNGLVPAHMSTKLLAELKKMHKRYYDCTVQIFRFDMALENEQFELEQFILEWNDFETAFQC
jgi:hypothetical protein